MEDKRLSQFLILRNIRPRNVIKVVMYLLCLETFNTLSSVVHAHLYSVTKSIVVIICILSAVCIHQCMACIIVANGVIE